MLLEILEKNKELYLFVKNYLCLIILFSLCFYLLSDIRNKTSNNLILTELQFCYYILIILLFFIINSILETPQEHLKQFLLIIFSGIFLSGLIDYIIVHYDKKHGFFMKLFIVLITTIIIFFIFLLIVYFLYEKKPNVSKSLFDSFNKSIKLNINIFICFAIFLFIFFSVFSILNVNSSITDIMCPFTLGCLLIFFIYCFIIYVCHKFKIINYIDYLNTFIVLSAISFFFGMIGIYIFIKSLKSICLNETSKEAINKEQSLSTAIFVSILILLWYDDVRYWNQLGYLLFIIITIFNFICFFYLMQIYPNISILSFWLMIEWLVTFFYKREATHNSVHYVFMKT